MSAIVKSIMGAAKHIPAGSTLGLLKKAIPSLGKFISGSLTSGFTATQLVNYLTDKMEDNSFLEKLDTLHGKNMLTPEEKILRRKEKEKKATGDIAKSIISFGAGALSGIPEGELEEEQTQEAVRPDEISYNEPKRISGPMPQKTGEGTVINVNPTAKQQKQADMTAARMAYNPIDALKKFPELMQFVEREAAAGAPGHHIAKKAKSVPFVRKYGEAIRNIEREISEPFEEFLGRLVGGQQQEKATQNEDIDLIQALQQLKQMRAR